ENYAKINPGLSKKFGFQSAAIVPLLSKGVAVGALNIASTKRYIISEEEKQTLISIGRELGSTIERMASEEDAKKASKNLETLFNSIDEMVFVLDMQGNIISVNDTVLKRLLYSSEELSGMNVLLLHVPERRCEALQIVQGMIAGTIDSCPVPVVSKDGTRIEVETKINRALWNNQEVLIGVTRDVTERKCAEEALRESEDKLQLALFGSATGMWELNIPSMIGAIDDRAADILGYKKIAIGSRSIDWDELSHPDDVPLIQKRLEDYLDGRTTIFESEHRMRHVSGEWVWVVGRGKITQYSEDRSSLRISGTLHNITNRKRTELELVTAQQRLKEAHQLAHIGTFDWNLETDTVTWSEQLFNIAGRDPLSGAPAYGDLPSLYSDTSWDLLNGAVTRSLSTGDPFNLELEMIRSDGSKRWTNNFGGVKHDEKGKLIRFFGTVQDINERKRVEEALEKAQEKYTKAFLASPDAITITDMETGRFVEVNDTTSRIYGYSRDEMIGKSAVELGIWLRNEDREDFIGKVKINGRVERYEAIGRQKSGKMFNGSISADIIKIGDSLHLISVIRDITERKIADEALRESEARVRKILEQAPLPLCYVNKDGVITFRNERFVQIFGYTAEDFPTLTEWWQQAYPDAHYRQWVTTTWDAALKRAIENGIDIRPVEYRVTCKSGEERIIEITGIILGDDFLATFIDLTERKQTEEKLQETNEYLNSLIDYANAPIIVWDPEYVITRFNHAFEDLAFMPEQEVIGQRLDILFPKESRGASLHQIQKTLEGEQWESVEIPILVKDGSVRTVLWNSANIVYPDGRILSTIAQGVDITDRKKAEEALGESEEQFRISIEKAPEAILLFDINQDRYIEANVEAERIFGCSRQQLLDSGPQQFYKPDQPDLQPIRETVDEHRRRVIAGEAIVFERYIRTTREEDLVMEVRLVLLQSTKRKLIRSSFIDITERKRAEEALSLAIKKLNLLSGITRHDINNQLTVLMGFLSILEEKYQDRSLSEYFQKVSKAAQRISSMIRFTKEYEEIGVHAPKWQDCHTIVDSVSKQAALGKVEVKNDLPVGAEVFADPLILKVFYNLMDNAVRYGGKITTIWFSVEGRGDVKVLVC
ncbi:MAG: PAS domain S-box protein, partial [Methanomicrobiales archaeon]